MTAQHDADLVDSRFFSELVRVSGAYHASLIILEIDTRLALELCKSVEDFRRHVTDIQRYVAKLIVEEAAVEGRILTGCHPAARDGRAA
jgi:hypothetical protein